MIPDDLYSWSSVGAPALVPGGDAAVVAVSGPARDGDEYRGALWRVPLGGAPAGPLTRGHHDSSPTVSPDGRWIAFVRAMSGARPQIHLVEAGGGEPFPVTDAPLGASDPQFSPDGSRLVFVARVPCEGRYVAGEDPRAEAPRLVTTFAYRSDGLGYTRDRPRRLFVVDVPAAGAIPVREAPVVPEATVLTPADLDVSTPRWFPDGTAVAAVASRHAGREQDLRRDAVRVAVPAHHGGQDDEVPDPLPLTDADAGSTLAVDVALPAADGRSLWLLASDLGPSGLDFVAALTGLHTVPLDGAGAPAGDVVRLTDPNDVDLDPAVIEHRGAGVLVGALRAGAVELVSVSPEGVARAVVTGEVVVSGVAAHGDRVVVTRASARSAGDVVLVDEVGSEHVELTDFSQPLRATGRLRQPERLVATAPDGYRVEGWLTVPDAELHGAGPYPTILMIHGGPFAQYTHALFDEVQVLAHAGYAVVHGNPRGSSGRGRAHGRAIHRAFGTVDTDDVLALLDHASADPRLDATRTGVMGGSYGGYLTAWLTTRTTRFAAAIVERGFLDPVSFVGSSDIGWFFGLEYLGDAAQDADALAAQSPLAHVADVRTPTLVIHSEEDWRCPVEQGQRWFVELKRRGVPTELLLFPGEGHELTRSGRPSHRVARFEHVLRWWDTHLPTNPR